MGLVRSKWADGTGEEHVFRKGYRAHGLREGHNDFHRSAPAYGGVQGFRERYRRFGKCWHKKRYIIYEWSPIMMNYYQPKWDCYIPVRRCLPVKTGCKSFCHKMTS